MMLPQMNDLKLSESYLHFYRESKQTPDICSSRKQRWDICKYLNTYLIPPFLFLAKAFIKFFIANPDDMSLVASRSIIENRFGPSHRLCLLLRRLSFQLLVKYVVVCRNQYLSSTIISPQELCQWIVANILYLRSLKVATYCRSTTTIYFTRFLCLL